MNQKLFSQMNRLTQNNRLNIKCYIDMSIVSTFLPNLGVLSLEELVEFVWFAIKMFELVYSYINGMYSHN